MTCSDVRRVLPDIVDGEIDADFQAHLLSCPACSELVDDLNLIVSEAGTLAETDEPPARVWVNIANQLRAEGIIRDPEGNPARPLLVPAQPRRWSLWWLAPVAAAVLAAGSYQLTHWNAPRSAPQVAQQSPAQPPAATPAVTSPANQPAVVAQSSSTTSHTVNPPAQAAKHQPVPAPLPKAETEVASNQNASREVSPPNEEDQRFLSEVSERAPGMRSTYENQLRAVNAEILETQAYIKRNPEDLDARQHLMEVYQQKAMLYQMALDRIQ